MKPQLFLSHTHQDKELASSVAALFEKVTLQQLEVWFSSDRSPEGGIKPGKVWLDEIREQLRRSRAVVPLLTPQSLSRPWLLFETGFGAAVDECEVIPLAIGIDVVKGLPFPLAMYQSFRLDNYESLRDAVAKIVTKYAIVFDEELTEPVLRKAVSDFAIHAADSVSSNGNDYDVFLACPMAGFQNSQRYEDHRRKVLEVKRTLESECKASVYFPANEIESADDFERTYVSSKKELEALQKSSLFVMIYPERMVSSVLFQAGLAMGYEKNSLHFAKKEHLPFLMKELHQLPREFPQVRLYEARTIDDVIHTLKREGPEFFSW